MGAGKNAVMNGAVRHAAHHDVICAPRHAGESDARTVTDAFANQPKMWTDDASFGGDMPEGFGGVDPSFDFSDEGTHYLGGRRDTLSYFMGGR